jgi:hypothetical protein
VKPTGFATRTHQTLRINNYANDANPLNQQLRQLQPELLQYCYRIQRYGAGDHVVGTVQVRSIADRSHHVYTALDYFTCGQEQPNTQKGWQVEQDMQ